MTSPPTDPVPTVEVHNVWAIHGMHDDGTPAAKAIAEHARPQDWGNPRWTYHRYDFHWEFGGTRYINHFHGWTDLQLKPHQYPELFASLIVQVLFPGSDPRLCGRDHLGEDDFWDEAWGEPPPLIEDEEEQEDLEVNGS